MQSRGGHRVILAPAVWMLILPGRVSNRNFDKHKNNYFIYLNNNFKLAYLLLKFKKKMFFKN